MRKSLVSVLVVVASLGIGSCKHASHGSGPGTSAFLKKHVGENCSVQFRRNVLGGAAPLPVSPLTGGINGVDVEVGGKLSAVESEGIVIETESNHVKYDRWIPLDSVLMVNFEVHPSSSAAEK